MSDGPKRIQRQRTKGWKMPANTVYVGRPTVWGNPFIGEGAMMAYRSWLMRDCVPYIAVWCPCCEQSFVVTGAGMSVQIEQTMYDGFSEMLDARDAILKNVDEIRGKDLACWCGPDDPCHADVLLELANR